MKELHKKIAIVVAIWVFTFFCVFKLIGLNFQMIENSLVMYSNIDSESLPIEERINEKIAFLSYAGKTLLYTVGLLCLLVSPPVAVQVKRSFLNKNSFFLLLSRKPVIMFSFIYGAIFSLTYVTLLYCLFGGMMVYLLGGSMVSATAQISLLSLACTLIFLMYYGLIELSFKIIGSAETSSCELIC